MAGMGTDADNDADADDSYWPCTLIDISKYADLMTPDQQPLEWPDYGKFGSPKPEM